MNTQPYDETRQTILIVDDVLSNVQILFDSLQEDYEVQFAISGEEALELIEEETPDLILLDVKMPGMSGHDVLAILRANEATSETPVIFVTADNSQTGELVGLYLGADDYVSKPFVLPLLKLRIRNLLERARLRRELKLQRDHLAHQVELRTAQLKEARDQAVRANAIKTEFLTNMSHEMRTPLNGILGMATLGLRRVNAAPQEKIARYFQVIAESGRQLLDLVTELLDVSKLERGILTFQQEAVVPATLVEVQLEELKPQIEAKKLKVECSLAQAPQTLVADSYRIGQVIGHLLNNAVKYSPEGETIRVALTACDLGTGRSIPGLRFVVKDRGCGIPESEMDAIFERFAQSSRTRTGAGGVGLGLAFSRDIVAHHQGQIRAYNNTDLGATFEVLLPLKPQAVAENQTGGTL